MRTLVLLATLSSSVLLSLAATVSSVSEPLRSYLDLSPDQLRQVAEQNQQFILRKAHLEARRLKLGRQLHAIPPALTSDPELRAMRRQEVAALRQQLASLDEDLLTQQQAFVEQLQGLLSDTQREKLNTLRPALFSDTLRCDAARANLLPLPHTRSAGYQARLAAAVSPCAVYSSAAR